MDFETAKLDLKTFLLNASTEEINEIIDDVHPVDVLEIIKNSSEDDAKIILEKLSNEFIGDLMDEEEDENRYEFLAQFSDYRQKDILVEMSSDEITDFIGTLDKKEKEDVLSKLSVEDKEEIHDLLQYDPKTAGGIMATEFIRIRENKTIQKTLIYLQEHAEDAEMAYYLYVIDKEDHLRGVVGLRNIVASPFDTLISEIVNENIISINVNDSQEVVAQVFSKYGYVMLPVVDDDNVIKGVVTIDDIVNIIKEESTEDIHKLAGLAGEEKIDGPLIDSIKSRLPWLTINLFTAILASLVVSYFSNTIQLVVALAAINPIISGMGGNAGTQSLTLMVRAIALEEISFKNMRKVFFKELGVGLLSGVVIGLLVAIGCKIVYNNYYLGLVSLLAMIGNMIVAVVSGYAVPLVLKKFNIDPALASSIFVTTFTDCIGFFLFLGLATAFLPKLL